MLSEIYKRILDWLRYVGDYVGSCSSYVCSKWNNLDDNWFCLGIVFALLTSLYRLYPQIKQYQVIRIFSSLLINTMTTIITCWFEVFLLFREPVHYVTCVIMWLTKWLIKENKDKSLNIGVDWILIIPLSGIVKYNKGKGFYVIKIIGFK